MSVRSSKYKLGLDIGSANIKFCLPSRRGRPLILGLDTPPGAVNKGVLQDGSGISDYLRQRTRQHQLDHLMVVSTLPASTLVLRHIQLPRMKPKDTTEAIEWEARRVLPFALEEAQLDWLHQGADISEGGEMHNYLLVAVRDSIIDRYATAIREAGLKLVALDIAPMALGRWLLKGATGSSLIIDIGAESTQVHFYSNTKLVFSRSLALGGAEATSAIAAAAGVNSPEGEARKLRGDYREQWLDSWRRELGREIQRSLEYYRANFAEQAGDSFNRVLLSGGGAMTKGIEALIQGITGVEPGFAEFASKDPNPRQDKIVYNVALGAGMWEGK